MKFSRVTILLAGSLAVTSAISAQTPIVLDDKAPVLTGAQPALPPLGLFARQAPPEPPLSALSQSDVTSPRAIEDRYRAEVKLLSRDGRQFVHCKLKNGKVLTGRLSDLGDAGFAIRTNALGDGSYVQYKDLAEPPRAVPAVGTQIKQGVQMTGFVIFVIVFFVPLALTGVIPSC